MKDGISCKILEFYQLNLAKSCAPNNFIFDQICSGEPLKQSPHNSPVIIMEPIIDASSTYDSKLIESCFPQFLKIYFTTVPDHIRPRVCSLPERPYNPRQSEDLYRLRTFSISKGTVVNCGDSIISRRSRSNTSVNSTTSR